MSIEIVYYIEKDNKIIESKIITRESKDDFQKVIEDYELKHPESKVTIIEDLKIIGIIKFFHEKSPVEYLKRRIEDLRDYFDTTNDYLSNIQNSMEYLEEEILKKGDKNE